MIKVSVLYPDKPGNTFDHEYYFGSHMPMVQRLLGSALQGIGAEQGIGGMGGGPAPFFAIAYLSFESMEAFEASFGPHSAQIMGDIPVYYNAEPVIQFSEMRFGS